MGQPQERPWLNGSPPLSWRLTSDWGCSFHDNSDGTGGGKGPQGRHSSGISFDRQWGGRHVVARSAYLGWSLSVHARQVGWTARPTGVWGRWSLPLGEEAGLWRWLGAGRIIVGSWLMSTMAKLKKAREGWPSREWCPGWRGGGGGKWGPGVCCRSEISSVWRAGSSSQLHCLSLPVGRQWLMELDELESQD